MLWGAALAAGAQSYPLEIILLQHRPAEQVIGAVRPFLERGATLSAYQNQLIVRTSPQNLAEIRRLLASLDAAPRRLLITVAQDMDALSDRSAVGVSGVIGDERFSGRLPAEARAGGGIVVEGGDGNSRLRAEAASGTAASARRGTQVIQMLEGNEASIEVGQSAPVPTRSIQRSVVNGQLVERITDSAQFVQAATGFRVRPRLAGQSVTLEIMPQSATLQSGRSGAIDYQAVSSVVSGRLGEWIEVAGSAIQSSGSQSEIGSRRAAASVDNRRVFLKVEELR